MKKYIIFSILITGLLIYNLTHWHNSVLGCVLLVIYLIYFGRRLGILALPNLSGFWQRLFGPLILLAAFSVLGTGIYYLYQFDNVGISFLLAILPILIIPFGYYFKKDMEDWSSGLTEPVPMVEPSTNKYNLGWWIVLIGDSYLLWYLFNHGSEAAIRSPWVLISPKFFLAFFILSLVLILYLKKISGSVKSLGLIFFHSLILLSAALLLYHNGFGFDPYLHQASEQHIVEAGFIEPKTPYYIGQYVLVVLVSKLTFLPLDLIDRGLLIILEAIYLAPLFFLVFRRVFNLERKKAKIASLLIFLLPFSHFISTTPQDLANFYTLAAVCFSLIYLSDKTLHFFVPLIFVLAALSTHPLTGIPLVLSFIILLLLKLRRKLTEKPGRQFLVECLLFIIFVGSLVVLPAIFILFQGANFNQPRVTDLWQAIQPFWPQAIKNHDWKILPAYLYQALLPYGLIILAFWSSSHYYLKNKKEGQTIVFLFFTYAIFVTNSLFLRLSVYFKDIGLAEQGQYSQRLGQFSFYLLLPLAIYGLFVIADKIKIQLKNKGAELSFLISSGLVILLAFGLTASFYLSYPRVDAYELSRYINTSSNDFAAVKKVEETSGGQPYIVLANISVSAASIKEFGFKKYFTTPSGEQIFYYSLPTGGALYHYFEDMVYKEPSVETMNKAMNLAGVKQGYLIINDYWDSFKKVLPLAQASAQQWWSIANKVYIFKYQQ